MSDRVPAEPFQAEPAATEAEPIPADLAPIEIVDVRPARIRRPLDLIRLSGLAISIAVLGVFGWLATSTTSGANVDLTRLLKPIPRTPVHALSRVGAFGVPSAIVVG